MEKIEIEERLSTKEEMGKKSKDLNKYLEELKGRARDISRLSSQLRREKDDLKNRMKALLQSISKNESELTALQEQLLSSKDTYYSTEFLSIFFEEDMKNQLRELKRTIGITEDNIKASSKRITEDNESLNKNSTRYDDSLSDFRRAKATSEDIQKEIKSTKDLIKECARQISTKILRKEELMDVWFDHNSECSKVWISVKITTIDPVQMMAFTNVQSFVQKTTKADTRWYKLREDSSLLGDKEVTKHQQKIRLEQLLKNYHT